MPAGAQTAFDFLFGLEQFGIKFGLDNIRQLLDALGHPEHAFRSVHIAGTNGKGSVTAMTDHALRTAGHRTGRYTSPHLVDLTERFVVDGRPIESTTLAAVISDLRDVIEPAVSSGQFAAPPTFFEVTTAAAFELFRRARVEVALCEVGLGGRLDATNVLEPAVTAITNIAFDHQKYLGDTLEMIAHEKGGIIKPGVPVVLGRLDPGPRAVIDRIAGEQGSPVVDALNGLDVTVGPEGRIRLRTTARDYGELDPALRGRHQVDNIAVAVGILETLNGRGVPSSADDARDGIERVSWPGRLDVRHLAGGRTLLLDAAHNPAGAAALARYLRDNGWIGVPLVFTAMRDKPAGEMLRELLPVVGDVILTRASNPRSADPSALAAVAQLERSNARAIIVETPAAALDAAWAISDRIVVAGSIFLLGDVLIAIEPRDTLRNVP